MKNHHLRLAGVVLAVTLTGCGVSGTDPNPTSASDPSPTAAHATDVTEPVRDQMIAWARSHSDDVNEGGQLMADAADAAGSYDTNALGDACNRIADWANRMQNTDPVPDPDTQAAWSSALNHATAGAEACQTGAATMDPTLLGEAGDEFSAMSSDITVATAAMRKYQR